MIKVIGFDSENLGFHCVTPYARRNALEDFAESYMCYLTRSGLLAAIPEKYRFLDALFSSISDY